MKTSTQLLLERLGKYKNDDSEESFDIPIPEDDFKQDERLTNNRYLRDIADIGQSFQKIGSIGGDYYKSDTPEFFERKERDILQDLKSRDNQRLQSQKDMLSTLDKMRSMSREQREAEESVSKKEREDRLFGLKERLTNAQIDKLNKEPNQKLDPLLDLKRQKLEKELAGENKKDVTGERSLKEIMAEEKYRYNSLTSNLNKLEELVKKHGTIDFVGPESGTKKSKLYQMAIDFAKVVDPKSVAREGEVKAAQDYLLSIDWTRPKTALKLLKEFREDLEDRRMAKQQALDEIYGETYRSISPPKAPVMPKKETRSYKGKDYEVKYDQNGKPYIDAEE